MGAQRYRALPDAMAGAAPASNATAWVFGSWVFVSACPADLALVGVSVRSSNIPSADATQEILIEIGTGAPGAEITKAQIPHSLRMDTTVGYYIDQTSNIFLPEPMLVRYGAGLSVRVADSITGAVTYAVKVFVEELSRQEHAFVDYMSVNSSGLLVGERVQ